MNFMNDEKLNVDDPISDIKRFKLFEFQTRRVNPIQQWQNYINVLVLSKYIYTIKLFKMKIHLMGTK
jgi:hypothetical protein